MNGKILYIKNSASTVNLNTYNVQALGLGRAFCELGFDYDFLYFSNENKLVLEEMNNNHRLRVISKKGIRVLRSYVCPKVLKPSFLQGYDFVISTEYGQIMTYLVSKKSNNVVMYSGPYYNLFKIPFVSPIYDKFFTASINDNCIAKFVKSELAKQFLVEKGYTELVNIGVGLDISRFEKEVDMPPETKRIREIMEKNRCILYVGSLTDRKNYPFLLSVYEKVLLKNRDVKFVLIGKGEESYIQKHMNMISSDAQKGVIRLESIENTQLKYIYPLAKAFLLPSKLEIFGMVLLEAMYLGAPVVTSWNGGSSTLIDGRDTGQIVRDFDVDLWALAVEKYLSDEEYKNKVVNKAQKLINEEFTWIQLANKMLSVILKNNNGIR